MYNVHLKSGEVILVNSEESLIDGAAKHSILLPHSCLNGRCKACICKIDGDTELLFEEAGLSPEESKLGFKLACARRPKEDLKLDIEIINDIDLTPPKLFPAKIHSKCLVTDSIAKIELKIPKSSSFTFHPGQYVDIYIQKYGRRSYSIAGINDENILTFFIKNIPGGEFSKYWFEQLKLHDLIRLKGPYGTFFMRNNAVKQLIFVATGTGIAPIKSMLDTLEKQKNHTADFEITLIWGNRRPSEFFINFYEYKILDKYVPVCSKYVCQENIYVHGYVQSVLKNLDLRKDTSEVYCCGSTQMVMDVKECCTFLENEQMQVFTDAFVATGHGEN